MNCNAEPASPTHYQAARNAGGLTWGELQKDGACTAEQLYEVRYYDAATGLWIPRGVLLFRPGAPKTVRDVLDLPTLQDLPSPQ